MRRGGFAVPLLAEPFAIVEHVYLFASLYGPDEIERGPLRAEGTPEAWCAAAAQHLADAYRPEGL